MSYFAQASSINYTTLFAHSVCYNISLIDFQSFPRWFTIRNSGIQYTKDFQKLTFSHYKFGKSFVYWIFDSRIVNQRGKLWKSMKLHIIVYRMSSQSGIVFWCCVCKTGHPTVHAEESSIDNSGKPSCVLVYPQVSLQQIIISNVYFTREVLDKGFRNSAI